MKISIIAVALGCMLTRAASAQTWVVPQRDLSFGSVVLGASISVAATSTDARSGVWNLNIGSGKTSCKVDLTLSAASSNALTSTASPRTINVTYTQGVLVNSDGTTTSLPIGTTVTKVKIVYPANVYIGGTLLESFARAGTYAATLTLTGANATAC